MNTVVYHSDCLIQSRGSNIYLSVYHRQGMDLVFWVPDAHCRHPLVVFGITQVIFLQILRYLLKPS